MVQLAHEGVLSEVAILRGWPLAGAGFAVARTVLCRISRGTGVLGDLLAWAGGSIVGFAMLASQGPTLEQPVDGVTVLAGIVAVSATLMFETVFQRRVDSVHLAWQGAALSGGLASVGVVGLTTRAIQGQPSTTAATYALMVVSTGLASAAVFIDERERSASAKPALRTPR